MNLIYNLLPTLRQLMKWTFIQGMVCLLTIGLSWANTGRAQEIMEQPVSLSADGQPLRQVFKVLEQETGVRFMYRQEVIGQQVRVNLRAVNERLGDVLERLLRPLSLHYELLGKRILITPAPRSAQVETAAPSQSQSADRPVTGRVTNELDEGLPGVSVVIKDTGPMGRQRGTSTDSEGRYRLSIPDGTSSTLVFSFVGYTTQEVAVGNRSVVDSKLTPDDKSLNEVVVVGYGTVKKSDLTGSVAKVSEADIKATPIVALDRAMQGRAPGVLVTQNSARPGGEATIRIRGTGSINAGNEPLYVIDGFPTGSLNSINPTDIESIEILKDASATAIYGSRGSNGVVIVTTKRGKAGQSVVAYEGYYGVQSVRRKIPLLNARQYAEFINEARINGGGRAYFDGSSASQPLPSALGEGTDWQGQVFREAPIQNHQLTLSGGETKTRYAITGSYYDQQGIIRNSYFKRYTLRANLDREVSSRVKVGLSMQGAFTQSNSSRTETDGGGSSGVTNAALNFAPTFPVFNPNGTYYRDLSTLNGNLVDNPLGLANEITDQFYTTRLLSNAFADIRIVDGLTFRTSLGADLINTKSNFYVTRQIGLGAGTNGSASVATSQNLSWLNENILTYTRTLAGKHNLTALLGYTAQSYHIENVRANAINFNDDFAQFNNLGAGATLQTPSSGAADWALISYLARVNYGYADRYLLTLTARRDGSSRFGPTNKYGFFPSGAFAWRIVNEPFMKGQRLFSDLKFRVSYGLSGNQEIGDYRYLSTIVVSSYPFGGANATLRTGGVPNGIANAGLRWEKNAQFDVGIDAGFLNNRIQLTADYYVKTTSDLLFSVNVPQTTGYSSALQNIGRVENRGLELGINTINLDKGGRGFGWTTEFNIAFNQNKILTLDGRPEFTTGDGSGHLQVSNTVLLKVGQPLGNFYGRVVEGIFQNQAEIDASAQKTARPGDFRFADLNSDGAINDLDRTVIGNGIPKFFGGLNNTFTYRGFDLNIFLQGSYGNSILNFGRFDLYNLNGNNNQSADVLNRWTPANPGNEIPRATSTGGQRILSTFHIEDGSYLRAKNISLGYTLPSVGSVANGLKRLSVRSLRIYASAQNYLTVTRYSGYDPEVSRFGTSAISQGMDYGGYPAAKTLLLGLNLTF